MRTSLFGRTYVRHVCEGNKEAHQNLSGNFLPGSCLAAKLSPAEGKSRINFPEDWSFPGKAFWATFSSVELGFCHFDVRLQALALSRFGSFFLIFPFLLFFHSLRISHVSFVWVLRVNFRKKSWKFQSVQREIAYSFFRLCLKIHIMHCVYLLYSLIHILIIQNL